MDRPAYTHPVALGALVLLLVNDHVLKAAWPGPVTGKLSDVAGPVVAAALLGSLVRPLHRRAEAVAWWAVAAEFAAVKTVPAATAAAVWVLSLVVPSAIVRDPWDVLGLLALPVAWRATRRPRPVPRPVRWAVAAVALGACVATGPPIEEGVSRVEVRRGEVLAEVTDNRGSRDLYRTTDGGLTWTAVSGPPPAATEPRTTACHGSRCYRIAPDLVEESRDGGTTWRVSLRDRRWRDEPEDPGDLSHRPADVAFVPGTDIVLVAVGDDGMARRVGDGPWHRVRVGFAEPPPPERSLAWRAMWVVRFALLPEVLVFALGLLVLLGGFAWLTRGAREAAPPAAGWPWAPPLREGPPPVWSPPPPAVRGEPPTVPTPPRWGGRYRRR